MEVRKMTGAVFIVESKSSKTPSFRAEIQNDLTNKKV
jgi:hypothetical protein